MSHKAPIWKVGSGSHPDLLYLIEAEFLAPAVVELRRARRCVVRHLRGLLQRAAVLQIRGDAGRPEAVVAEPGGDASRSGTPADHGISVGLGQGRACERSPRVAPNGAEQRPLGILGEARTLDVGGEVGFKVVVAGHGVRLAAFLPQPDPEPTILREHVLDRHPERRADAREAEHHQPDQRPVTQPGDRRHLDAVDQCRSGRRSLPIGYGPPHRPAPRHALP